MMIYEYTQLALDNYIRKLQQFREQENKTLERIALEEKRRRKARLDAIHNELAQLSQLLFFDLTRSRELNAMRSSETLVITNDWTLVINDTNFISTNYSPIVITSLVQLESLDLSASGIVSIPNEISSLRLLSTLFLNNNRLTTLPPVLFEIVTLTSLNFRVNHVTEIPEAISSLTNLTQLDGSYNSLTTLPFSFDRLPNLENIALLGNKFTILPQLDLNKLESLRAECKIYLHNVMNRCQIVTVPEGL
jgi:hypothetical protein